MAHRDQTPRFGSLLTAMITPFDERGALDVEGCARLARHLVEHGSDGLVLAGTTGEGPTLSDDERVELWRSVRAAVSVPLIAGTGTNDTAHSIELTKRATETGVDAVLVVTPYYNRPSQAGLAAHFTAVAAATSLPVMLYDIPIRSGRRILTDTMLALAHEVPNIVAVKDSAQDPPATAHLVAAAPADFEVYCGDDSFALAFLSVGAVGLVSVAAHWAGPELSSMMTAFTKGDVIGARELNTRLLASYDFETSEAFPNPLPAKAACRTLGLPAGQCRLPMGPAPASLDERAAEVIELLGTAARAGSQLG